MPADFTAADLELLELLDANRRYNAKDFFEPYAKQKEFIALGKLKYERLLFAGNQLGKSYVGAYETACHLTGLYPPDWPGRIWRRPVKLWAAGESTTVVRDVSQKLLCGPAGDEENFGTGFIPRRCFVGKPSMARGAVADAYDNVKVQHFTDGIFDGISSLQFKSYEQGRKKFQGATLDGIWWDEEPEAEIYTEGNARWSATHGMSWMTFTPLLGMSTVVKRFMHESDAYRAYLTMGIADAKHMTPEMQKELLSKYPENEWAARMNGQPMLGEGRIFTVDEAVLRCPSLA
jgi:phage terminase large subunit-like protein